MKVLCVHSLAAHGVVGLKPFIATLGESALAVPSLLLTGPGNMPGCRRFTYDFSAMLEGTLAAAAAQGERVVVFVGYLADAEQVTVLEQALERHAETVAALVVDPICGDHGRPYVAPALIAAWPRLLARADWALPNLTEIALLSEKEGEEAVAVLRYRFPRLRLIVTSWPAGGAIATRLYDDGGVAIDFPQPRIAGEFHGTGDLFAAVWTREVFVGGASPGTAIGLAGSAVAQALRKARERGRTEVVLGAD